MIHGVSIRVARTNRAINATSTPPTRSSGIVSERSRVTASNREAGNSLFSSGVSVAKADLPGAGGDHRASSGSFLSMPTSWAALATSRSTESRTTSPPPPSSRAAT